MIGARLGFYVMYVILGAVILVRLLSIGFHWQTVSGLVVGAALIALGVYRLNLYARMRRVRRR